VSNSTRSVHLRHGGDNGTARQAAPHQHSGDTRSPGDAAEQILSSFGLLAALEPGVPAKPFDVEIVAPRDAPSRGASGLPIAADRSIDDVDRTDIAIVPLMMFAGGDWKTGRYPQVVDWLQRMHRGGATLCSTCTGVLLLAETGLLDGREATIHWAFAPTFQRNFPNVGLRLEEVLIAAGKPERFVMTGGVMSWHDLALHLIARHVGPSAAQSMARLMLLDWHSEGQAPYLGFLPAIDHDDALVRDLQKWLEKHFSVANPIEEMALRCGLSSRSLERRFLKAAGLVPIAYVQNLRIEAAKRHLERTKKPVDEISHEVGYENPAFFRRVFKRNVRMPPSVYRRKFLIPEVARSR
jgi:transcriptional regulator GlxA family with amidase domain